MRRRSTGDMHPKQTQPFPGEGQGPIRGTASATERWPPGLRWGTGAARRRASAFAGERPFRFRGGKTGAGRTRAGALPSHDQNAAVNDTTTVGSEIDAPVATVPKLGSSGSRSAREMLVSI